MKKKIALYGRSGDISISINAYANPQDITDRGINCTPVYTVQGSIGGTGIISANNVLEERLVSTVTHVEDYVTEQLRQIHDKTGVLSELITEKDYIL